MKNDGKGRLKGHMEIEVRRQDGSLGILSLSMNSCVHRNPAGIEYMAGTVQSMDAPRIRG